MTRRAAPIAMLAFLVCMMAGQAMAASKNTTIEQQFIHITRNLRCLTCDGQSIHESNSEFATRIKKSVVEKLQKGQSEKVIYADLKAHYGDAIDMMPPHKGGHILLWILPFVFACATLTGLYGVYYRKRKRFS